MEVGKPLRTITVEPLVLPVPSKEPASPPAREPSPVPRREKQPA
jgi:hypothetical protein